MVNSDFVNSIEKLLDLKWCIPAQAQDFPGRNLLQRASRTPEELLSGANFPRRLLQRVHNPERSAPAYF
jgi:hypothetical protein